MAVPEQQIHHTLRIGDVILLHSKEGKGYVFSDTLSSKHLTLSVLQEMNSPDNPDIPDIRTIAFKVLAPNISKAQERYADLKKKLLQNTQNLASNPNLENAKRNAELEVENNKLEQMRKKGTKVVYGSTIQLQHIYSNKYVAISTDQTSKTENTNMQIYLLDHDSENCLFEILPRYKVRSVGNEVRMEDQVIFASEKTEGQYIHTSSRNYHQSGITLHGNNHEINASATGSGYTIKSHYYSMPNEERVVKGGSIIRLFHRELECYLTAEGSFANDDDKVVVEEVHLRKRKSDHGNLKAPSTSSITYWQIEKDKKPLSGQVVNWEETCRIKHLPTRLYLAVVKGKSGGYKVTLKKQNVTSTKTDLDIVFRLFSVTEEDTGVELGSFARINHPHTKTWLVAQKGKNYTRKEFDPKATGLGSLQWDSAELFQIGVQRQMSYDDAFTVEEIDEDLIKKFTYVAGVVPVIKAYITELNSSPEKINTSKASAVQKVLLELSGFIIDAQPRRKDHQKLLRNLKVLEMAVHILDKYDEAHNVRIHQPVCKACYYLIKVYLFGQSRKNENYLARFISFFERQIGMKLKAEETLTELVRDNALIVSKFGDAEIDNIINKLMDSKNPIFFDYLGVLCVCNGLPIPKNQDYIIDRLINQHGKELLYLTEVHDKSDTSLNKQPQKTKQIKYYSPDDPSKKWQPLSKIAGNVQNTPMNEEFCFLVAQLDLFGKLCKGNNENSVLTIDKTYNYLTFEEALVGAQDDDLHPELRSKYVELIVVLYVDVGKNRAILDSLSLSFVYDKVTKDPYKSAADDEKKALTGVTNEYFPDLKKWILSHVENNQEVTASTIKENNLTAEVLDLLCLLVKYGYYANLDDINALIPPLVSLLNGKNDKPYPKANDHQSSNFRQKKRFESNKENRAVANMKIKALKVMDLFFNFRFYLRLQHFIFDYKELKKCYSNELEEVNSCNTNQTPSGRDRFPARMLQQVSTDYIQLEERNGDYLQPNEHLWYLREPSCELKILDAQNENLRHLAIERLNYLFSWSKYHCDDKKRFNFPEILIDLSNYQNDQLLHESLHLLGRVFSAEENLMEKAIQTQLLITDQSKGVFDKVQTELSTLRHNAQIDMNEKQHLELIEILDHFMDLCHLEEDESHPHKQNQMILYNTGVFSDIVNLIFRDESSHEVTSDNLEASDNFRQNGKMKQREDILAKCFQFLKLLARGYITVQERLFDRLDDFLELNVAIPQMADLLSEVFTGGQEICLKIKEQQVETIFSLIARDDTTGRAELLEMLQAVVKVENLDLPLKRNQAYVIKYFSKTRDKFCKELLGLEDDKVERRKELLLKADKYDPDLQLLLKLIDLLASCSEGENSFIESICHNIMEISELLQILSMPELDPLTKKPFVRFLLWVYMTTGGDKMQVGSTVLHHDQQMWSFLEQTNLLVDGLVKALVNIPKSKIASSKHILACRSMRLSQHKQGIRKTAAKSTASNVLHVIDENGELIPGLLTYLMEGILPMFKVYFTEYYKPDDTSANATGDSLDRASPDKEIQISATLVCSLTYLADVIKSFLSSPAQWNLLCIAINIISSKQPSFDNVSFEIDPEVKQRFDNADENDDFIVPALQAYEKTYHEEMLLNCEFNNFVRNYELAYWGPNTALHQIGSPYENVYSEFDDEKNMEEKGDEWLPLGKSFQNHVKLYVKYDNKRNLPAVSIKSCTKRIIDFLESSNKNLGDLDERERQRQDKMNIRYLQLLRALIHNQIMFVDNTLKEEGQDPALYRTQCKHVKSVQDQIQNLGNTGQRISLLLTHPNDNISAEALAFLSMLLYNGNKTVQEGFNHLRVTREEHLVVSMQQRLQQAILNETERRALLAQLVNSQTPNLEVQSPEPSMYGRLSTVSLLEEMPKKLSVTPDEPVDASTMQQLYRSEAYHGQTDTNKSPTKKRRKRYGLFTEVKLFRQSSDEQTVQDECEVTDNDHKDKLKFKDTSYIDLVLRVLGLMCDGQYRPMQNYLREQPGNIKSINLVSETCTLLSSFYVDITKDNIKLINSVLQTLLEMSVGNIKNQQVLFNHQIIDTINRILQMSTTEDKEFDQIDVLELKQSAVVLLEAMCEETHQDSKKLVQNIHKAIDIGALHDTFYYFHLMSEDDDMKKKEKDDDAERAAFRTYHVLVHMADFEEIPLSSVEPKKPESKEEGKVSELYDAWEDCKKDSKSIEVLYKNDENKKVLAKVHFRTYDTDELPEALIEEVKYQVNRDSPEDKARDFLKWMVAAKKEINHLTDLHQHWYAKMFIYQIKKRSDLLIVWTIIMNIMLMIAWSDVDLKFGYAYNPPEDAMSDPMISGYCVETSCYNNVVDNSTLNFTSDFCDPSYCEVAKTLVPTLPDINNNHWFFDYMLYIGGALHLWMSLVMVISYFLINARNFVLPAFVRDFLENAAKKFPTDSCYQKILKRLQLNTPCEYADEPLFGLRALYHIVFVACSALSLSFYGYFYCVCLLHIVIDNDILQRVLKSVTKNGQSLLWVGALGLVVIYIYSVGTFAFLPNEFHEPDPEEPGDSVRFCRSLFQCFVSVLEYGLLDTLGATIDLPSEFDDAAIRAIFFDLTFFIIVTTIGLNIVFGIIVDTFSELRDEKWTKEADMKTVCFICGNASYEFERRAEGFDHHVKYEHCMWDYIYYYIHLGKIDVSDHNAIESYVYQQIKEKRTDFFPLFLAKSLKDKENETLTEIAELKSMIQKVMGHFEQQKKVATLRRKREEQAQWDKDSVAAEEH